MYEAAAQRLPWDEELANQWFMAIVRKDPPDYKSLQQAAMKINKQFKNSKYYLWTVMATYLQALPGGSTSSLFLNLAEKMMDKAITDGHLKDFEGILS
jgi:hypothetical protein